MRLIQSRHSWCSVLWCSFLCGLIAAGVTACGEVHRSTVNNTPTPLSPTGPIAGSMQFTAQADPNGVSNAALVGADVEIRWSWLEPNAPANGTHQYDWAQFDDIIARWHAAGKRVMLLVHYTDYTGSCSSQQEMPAWEIARIQHVCDSAYGVVTPNYFDPTFITDLRTFVHAIGDHYAASPYKGDIAYVRIGVGVGGEAFPNKTGPNDQPTWSQMQSWGYTPYTWREWIEDRLSDYKSMFPWTRVIAPVNNQFFTDPQPDPTTGLTGLTLQMEIAYWAASRGFGIGQQGLAPGYNYAGIRDICRYVRAHWPGTFIQFQTTSGTRDADTINGDIQTAFCYGGTVIEWYAKPANDPAFASAYEHFNDLVTGRVSAPADYCSSLA